MAATTAQPSTPGRMRGCANSPQSAERFEAPKPQTHRGRTEHQAQDHDTEFGPLLKQVVGEPVSSYTSLI